MENSLSPIKINKKILKELGYVMKGDLHIPDVIEYKGVKYQVTKIDKNGFKYCRNLLSVSIPESVTDIETSAFACCVRLARVEYRGEENNQLLRIHDNAFDWTRQTEIILPPHVISLGRFSFADNFNATSIVLPESLTSIDNFAFSNCPNVEHIVIPDSVVSLGAHVFDGCEGLNSVQLSCNINSLREGTFADCWNLTELLIPEGVQKIDLKAFDGCANMKHVHFPNTTRQIYHNTWLWQNCTQYFSYNGSRVEWKDMWDNYNSSRLPLSQPVKCLDGALKRQVY